MVHFPILLRPSFFRFSILTPSCPRPQSRWGISRPFICSFPERQLVTGTKVAAFFFLGIAGLEWRIKIGKVLATGPYFSAAGILVKSNCAPVVLSAFFYRFERYDRIKSPRQSSAAELTVTYIAWFCSANQHNNNISFALYWLSLILSLCLAHISIFFIIKN